MYDAQNAKKEAIHYYAHACFPSYVSAAIERSRFSRYTQGRYYAPTLRTLTN